MGHFQFVRKSSNAKTGPIPTTTSPRKTCPPSCPLIGDGGCYAEAGYYTRLNWDAVDAGSRGGSWTDLIAQAHKLPAGQLWRHNVAGDLPPIAPDEISETAVTDLVTANRGKRGFTYTHYPMTRKNAAIVRKANASGFTINASANTIKQAADYMARGLPAVCLVSQDHGEEWRKLETRSRGQSFDVIRCPAEYRDDVTCASCGLCQRSGRRVVVGFTVHGTRSAAADIIARA
jgi:hypothetical protein